MSPADSGTAPSLLPAAVPVGTKVTLHLGVIDQPYRSWDLAKGAKRRKQGRVLPRTTYDVAKILESKYGIMGTFYAVHELEIMRALEESIQGSLESLVMRRQLVMNPWARATQIIEDKFKDFINSGASERCGIPGTPTKAAKRGVNHRLRRPYAKSNPRRPSFRDTGLFVSSFKSWID